jgi:hypothetical protein
LREEQDNMAAPSIGTRLRAAMTEQGSSYTKLIAAMRRVAAAKGERLPETRSLVTTLSYWSPAIADPDADRAGGGQGGDGGGAGMA